MGISLVALNVDNYFHDLDKHPQDEFGDYDFETPQALDLPLINQHLSELIEGKEVHIPFYDFMEGKRKNNQTKMRIGESAHRQGGRKVYSGTHPGTWDASNPGYISRRGNYSA